MELVSCHAYGAYNFEVVTTFLENLWTPWVDGSQGVIRVVCENCNNELMGASFLRVEGSLGWEGEKFLIVWRLAKCFSGWRVYCLPSTNFRRPREEETVFGLFVTWTGSPTRGKSQMEIGSSQMLSDILEFARSWKSLGGKVTCLHGLARFHPPLNIVSGLCDSPNCCHGWRDYRSPFTAETRIWSRKSPRDICGGQSGNGTGFCLSTVIVIPSLFDAHSSFICNWRYMLV